MVLKRLFAGCLRVSEGAEPRGQPAPANSLQQDKKASASPALQHTSEHAGSSRSPFPQRVASQHLALCQALVDGSPEPISVYDFATGGLILCNSASRMLASGSNSLAELFVLDPPSLDDALSRVQAGLCWRGLLQLPNFPSSAMPQPLVYDGPSAAPPWDAPAWVAPGFRTWSPSRAEVVDSPPAPGSCGLYDHPHPQPQPQHQLPTSQQLPPPPPLPQPQQQVGAQYSSAHSNASLRQALQLVAYPSLRLHGAAPPLANTNMDETASSPQPPTTDSAPMTAGRKTSLAFGKAGAGNWAVTAVTAGAATTAADAIAKATRAAAAAKAAAAAAAAEAAAEAAAAAGIAGALGLEPVSSRVAAASDKREVAEPPLLPVARLSPLLSPLPKGPQGQEGPDGLQTKTRHGQAGTPGYSEPPFSRMGAVGGARAVLLAGGVAGAGGDGPRVIVTNVSARGLVLRAQAVAMPASTTSAAPVVPACGADASSTTGCTPPGGAAALAAGAKAAGGTSRVTPAGTDAAREDGRAEPEGGSNCQLQTAISLVTGLSLSAAPAGPLLPPPPDTLSLSTHRFGGSYGNGGWQFGAGGGCSGGVQGCGPEVQASTGCVDGLYGDFQRSSAPLIHLKNHVPSPRMVTGGSLRVDTNITQEAALSPEMSEPSPLLFFSRSSVPVGLRNWQGGHGRSVPSPIPSGDGAGSAFGVAGGGPVFPRSMGQVPHGLFGGLDPARPRGPPSPTQPGQLPRPPLRLIGHLAPPVHGHHSPHYTGHTLGSSPSQTPRSHQLLEALTTSTWGARMNGRHRRPMRRATTSVSLGNASGGTPGGGGTVGGNSAAATSAVPSPVARDAAAACATARQHRPGASVGGEASPVDMPCAPSAPIGINSRAGRLRSTGGIYPQARSLPYSEGVSYMALQAQARQSAWGGYAGSADPTSPSAHAAAGGGPTGSYTRDPSAFGGSASASASAAMWVSATSAALMASSSCVSEHPPGDLFSSIVDSAPRAGVGASCDGCIFGGMADGETMEAGCNPLTIRTTMSARSSAGGGAGGANLSNLGGGFQAGHEGTGQSSSRWSTTDGPALESCLEELEELPTTPTAPQRQLHPHPQPHHNHNHTPHQIPGGGSGGAPLMLSYRPDTAPDSHRLRRGVSSGFTPESPQHPYQSRPGAPSSCVRWSQSDVLSEDLNPLAGSRTGSAVGVAGFAAVSAAAGSGGGISGSPPVGSLGVLPRMLDLATKASSRTVRPRASASRLGLVGGQGLGSGAVLANLTFGGPASEQGSSPGTHMGDEVALGGMPAACNNGMGAGVIIGVGGGGGGVTEPGASGGAISSSGGNAGSGGGGGLLAVAAAAAAGGSSVPQGSFTRGASVNVRPQSFSRLGQRVDFSSPVGLDTIRSNRTSSNGTTRDHGLPPLPPPAPCTASAAAPPDGHAPCDAPSNQSVAATGAPARASRASSESVGSASASVDVTTRHSPRESIPPPSNRTSAIQQPALDAARKPGAVGSRQQLQAWQGSATDLDAGAPVPSAPVPSTPGFLAALKSFRLRADTGGHRLSNGAAGSGSGGGGGGELVPSGLELLPSAPEAAGVGGESARLLVGGLHTSDGAHAGRPPEMERWHEVVVSGLRHPVTGTRLIMVTQHDVSARVWAEQQLARVMEAEHALLEAIFPAHVLEHIAIMAAASAEGGCGDEAEAPQLLAPRPTLQGIAASAFAQAEAAGLVAGGLRSAAPHSPPYGAVPEQPALPITGDTFLHLATSHTALTVLFCDIQGFTTMCNLVKPATVMAFLNDLYTRLDAMLDAFGVYKVETIGDCYVAAGGLMKVDEETGAVTVRSEDVDPQHAKRTVQFAKALLRAGSAVRLPTTGEPVRLRVGIHSGPAMSGVVGTRMPRFCLFGDTINTASRMESTGVPGAIHVSQATRDLLPEEAWEATGGVEAKGKGLMQTYLLRPPLEPFST